MLEAVHSSFKKMSGNGRNSIRRVSDFLHKFKIQNIAAICSADYNPTRKDVIQKHSLLRKRFEEIELFADNEEWMSENILEIAYTLNSPEEDILNYPAIPSSSEKNFLSL